jgi:hypothetical protein
MPSHIDLLYFQRWIPGRRFLGGKCIHIPFNMLQDKVKSCQNRITCCVLHLSPCDRQGRINTHDALN